MYPTSSQPAPRMMHLRPFSHLLMPVTFAIIAVILLTGTTLLRAGQPVIEVFTADRLAVDYERVEEGVEAVNMSWKAVGLADQHRMRMEAWVGERWVLIGEDFAPEKSDRIVISHPLTFGHPLYRLSVLDASGTIAAEKYLELSYLEAEADAEPLITEFMAPVSGGLQADALNRDELTVPVTWQIRNRGYAHQPVIEQVRMPSGDVIGSPISNLQHWRPRQGQLSLTLAPVDGDTVFLRLRVVDRFTMETLTEQIITLPVVTVPQGPLSVDEWLHLDDETLAHVRELVAAGQAQGHHPDGVIKIGDSNIAEDSALCNFVSGNYDIGSYTHLQAVIDRFAVSLCAESAAAGRSFSTVSVLDPMWADSADCLPEETPLTCAIRVNKPAYAVIYLGVQDLERLAWNPDIPAESFRENLTTIIQQLTDSGVVPILTTFPTGYTFHNDGSADALNAMLREAAGAAHIPLIDLRGAVVHYPNHGVDVDGFHMSTPPAGRTSFTGNEWIYSRTLYELLVLETLYRLTAL